MLRQYKVPVGLNESERETIKEYFDKKNAQKGFIRRIFSRRKRSEFDELEGMMNDHSRVFYLMAPDNKFLAFYPIDIDENELAEQMIEEISYDLGTKYIS